MSFHRMTTSGSSPSRKSRAVAARTIRSPSSSSVWTSIRWWLMSFRPSRPCDRVGDLGDRAEDHAGLLDGLRRHLLDAVQVELVGDLVHEVADVVEDGRQVVDVLAVDRRHERLVDELDDLVGDAVALVLAVLDLVDQGPPVGVVLEQVEQELRRRDEVRRCPVEEWIEPRVCGVSLSFAMQSPYLGRGEDVEKIQGGVIPRWCASTPRSAPTRASRSHRRADRPRASAGARGATALATPPSPTRRRTVPGRGLMSSNRRRSG